jgi:serine/threonine protein kinase
VWKARDTTLDRDVALKILPAEGASSEVRRERFFREARAPLLNHPNIVTVYEINSEGDTDFIAMEYVEGETLSARLTRARCRSARRSKSRAKWQMPWRGRTRPESFTAI